MKTHNTPLKPLKMILDYIFIVVLVSILFNIIAIILAPIFPDSDILVKYADVPTKNSNLSSMILIITSVILNIAFIYSIYVFKKIVDSLFQDSIFTRFQILSLKLLGQLIILLIILKSIFNIFSNIVFEKSKVVGIHVFSFDSSVMAICIGLFFIYLSYVFKKAKALKEENELTV